MPYRGFFLSKKDLISVNFREVVVLTHSHPILDLSTTIKDLSTASTTISLLVSYLSIVFLSSTMAKFFSYLYFWRTLISNVCIFYFNSITISSFFLFSSFFSWILFIRAWFYSLIFKFAVSKALIFSLSSYFANYYFFPSYCNSFSSSRYSWDSLMSSEREWLVIFSALVICLMCPLIRPTVWLI